VRKLPGDTLARLSINTLIEARQVYAIIHTGRGPDNELDARKRVLLEQLQRLSELSPSLEALRRLAIMQQELGDPRWSETLMRLATAPDAASALASEREMALWQSVLGNRPIPQDAVPGIRDRIEEMNLGWYRHLALEALYSRAAMDADARLEVEAGLRAVTALNVFSSLLDAAGWVGGFLGLALIGFCVWRKRNPLARVPRWLDLRPPPQIWKPQANALHVVFLSYLAAYAVFQLAMTRLLWPVWGERFSKLSPPLAALATLSVTLLWVAVPALVYWRMSAKCALKKDDIGLRVRSLGGDIIWGIGAYIMALPLLLAAASVSSYFFRNMDTPLPPAISQFAGAPSIIARMVVITQAVALAPLIEETMFRGVFFRAMTPKMGWVAAMFITSALFALLHPQLPFGFLSIFVLGLVFNMAFALRGSLVPGIVAHSINNAGIILFLMLVVSG
jgi:membrane protease YdiL (CAAX protease family)